VGINKKRGPKNIYKFHSGYVHTFAFIGSRTSVIILCSVTEKFNVGIGVHQGLALSTYFFSGVMDEVTKDIQVEIPWCMFADDIVLVGDLKSVHKKLDEWRLAFERKGLRISRNKIKYIEYDFRGRYQEIKGMSRPKDNKW
jgi:hypothetical protein